MRSNFIFRSQGSNLWKASSETILLSSCGALSAIQRLPLCQPLWTCAQRLVQFKIALRHYLQAIPLYTNTPEVLLALPAPQRDLPPRLRCRGRHRLAWIAIGPAHTDPDAVHKLGTSM